MGDVPSAGSGQDRLLELRASAKGWHGVQMAVLGFIGLCGVLQRDDAGDPTWLQVWALLLAVAALLTALWAIVLVGRAAWPLYGPQPELPSELDYEARLRVASRQLSRGLALTFVSVALLALGTASAWWPSSAEAAAARWPTRRTASCTSSRAGRPSVWRCRTSAPYGPSTPAERRPARAYSACRPRMTTKRSTRLRSSSDSGRAVSTSSVIGPRSCAQRTACSPKEGATHTSAIEPA
jgi:hypothetical protein